MNNVQKVQDSLPVGAVIQGRYIVKSLFSKGGFGSIYLVRDQHIKQKLFVLAEVINPNKQESYSFTLEYVSLTPFRHQALPQIQYVFNDDKLNRAYLLMNYIEEPNLEIMRLQQSEKRFPLPQVMALMTPILNAVTYLHHQSPPVIHRNIKPAIIIPTITGESVLLMLGLVKEYDSTTTTLHYLAPGYGATEQYEGEYSARTDIYGLGATCYTLLTGSIPPDALYRSTQLSNGEIDPLQPIHEVIPTIPTFMVEAIQRAMSINADDRFSSVQQFEKALKPEPFIVPSVPTVQQAPVPEVPPLLAVTEELPMPEVVPSTLATEEPPTPEVAPPVSVAQEPPVPEVVPSIFIAEEPSVAEITLSPLIAEEPAVPEVVSSAPTQSPVIPEKVVEAPAESLPIQPCTVLSREPGTLRPASSRLAVEKPAAASAPKQPRARKPGVLLIILTLIMSLGIAAVVWSDIPGYPVAHSGVSTPSVKSFTPTPPSVSSIYPMLTGMYSGTIYDLSVEVSTSMVLSGIRQSQGNISGYLTLGPKLQGSGPFSGTINTTKELKFVVTDSAGNATLFFEGVMQSGASLTGDYYRCSPIGLSQVGQCSQAPGSYGIWNIVLTS